MRLGCVLFLLLLSGCDQAKPKPKLDFHNCVLSKISGSQANLYSRIVIEQCKEDFPEGFEAVVDKTSAMTPKECAVLYGADTPDELAVKAIYSACQALYKEPPKDPLGLLPDPKKRNQGE